MTTLVQVQEQMEATGGVDRWGMAEVICEQDGKVKCGRSAWWTQQVVGMFKVIEHLIDSVGLTESEALDKACTIFNSARDSPGKKPGIKKLNVALKKWKCSGSRQLGGPRKHQTTGFGEVRRRPTPQANLRWHLELKRIG
jgi:hypothetical protein